MKVDFKGQVSETGITLTKWGRHQLKKLKKGDVWFEVDDRAPKRSSQQNRLYWTWVTIIAESLGYTKDELHEIFKNQFITHYQVMWKGKAMNIPKSTTTLSKSDFVEYMMTIERFAAEEGIELPDPNEFDLILNEKTITKNEN